MKFTRAERRSAIIISQAIAWLVINRSAKFEQRLPERRIKCTESTSRDIIPLSRPRKIIPLVSRDSPLPPPPRLLPAASIDTPRSMEPAVVYASPSYRRTRGRRGAGGAGKNRKYHATGSRPGGASAKLYSRKNVPAPGDPAAPNCIRINSVT